MFEWENSWKKLYLIQMNRINFIIASLQAYLQTEESCNR